MRRHPRFIPSFRRPLLDLVIAAVIFGVAGYYHFRSDGQAEVGEARATLAQAQDQGRLLVADSEEHLQAARADYEAQADSVRSLHAAHEQYLLSRIEVERDSLASLDQRLSPLESAADSLLAQLGQTRSTRNELKAALQATEEQVSAERARVQELELNAGVRESDVRDRRQRLVALADKRPRVRATLGAFLERRGAASSYSLQVSRGLLALGSATLGLDVGIGFDEAGSEADIQGGAFARLPVYGQRWSAEISTGLHRRGAGGTESAARTGMYYIAALRFSPLRRSALRLLAGLGNRHGEAVGRFGLAWGL